MSKFKLDRKKAFISMLISISLVTGVGALKVKSDIDAEYEEQIQNNIQTTQVYDLPDHIDEGTIPQYDNSKFIEKQDQNPDVVGVLVGDLLPEDSNHQLQVLQDDIKGSKHLNDGAFGDISNLSSPGSASVIGGHNTAAAFGGLYEYKNDFDNNYDKPLYLFTADTVYELDLAGIRVADKLTTAVMNQNDMKEYTEELAKDSIVPSTGINIAPNGSVLSIYCCTEQGSARTNDRYVFDFNVTDMYKLDYNSANEIGKSL